MGETLAAADRKHIAYQSAGKILLLTLAATTASVLAGLAASVLLMGAAKLPLVQDVPVSVASLVLGGGFVVPMAGVFAFVLWPINYGRLVQEPRAGKAVMLAVGLTVGAMVAVSAGLLLLGWALAWPDPQAVAVMAPPLIGLGWTFGLRPARWWLRHREQAG